MSDLTKTTLYLPPALWRRAKKVALRDKTNASDIVRKSLEAYLDGRTRAGQKQLREKRAPAVQTWFDAYNEARATWGDQLDPPRPLRAVALTPPARRLIEKRIETYGLTRLLAILYKVPWNDYLMGRGRYREPRLSVASILKITEKINAVELLETLEDPRIREIRHRMAQIEEEVSKIGTDRDRHPMKFDALTSDRRRTEKWEEWEALNSQMQALKGGSKIS